MADNITLDPGTGGDTVATEDIGGVEYQKVKLVSGTAASTQTVATGNGTNAAALRVTVASDSTGVIAVTDNAGSLTVDNGGTFAIQDSEKVADNAAFTDGTTKVLPAGYIYDEVAGTALTENDAAAARINVNRAQVGIIEDGITRGRYATVSAANALKVDASGVAVPITDNSGSLTVDAPVATPVAVRLSDGAAFITALPITDNAGSLTVDNNGTFAVQATVAPATTGGLTIGPASGAKLLSAASTNATSVKGSAGQVYGWYLYNAAATVSYLKLYNKATAPTVGSDTPTMVIPIPAGSAANVEFSQGIAFGTGIGLAITAGVADADATAVAANDVVVNLFFK